MASIQEKLPIVFKYTKTAIFYRMLLLSLAVALHANLGFAKEAKVPHSQSTHCVLSQAKPTASFGDLKISLIRFGSVTGPANPDDPMSVGMAEYRTVRVTFKLHTEENQLDLQMNAKAMQISKSGELSRYSVRFLRSKPGEADLEIKE